MPVVKVYPGGSSGGFRPPAREVPPGQPTRGKIVGWTPGMVRRQIVWLWSVKVDALGRDGWAVTLTTGGTPDSAASWTAARKMFLHRMAREGVVQHHWVTEWTAKGRPHLHLSMFGGTMDDYRPTQLDTLALVHWLEVCDHFGWDATPEAQHITPITGATGWLEYVSKHTSRGVMHYQRQGAPDGWESTGKLWGKGGPWAVESPVEVDLLDAQFYRFRRLVMRYQQTRYRRRGGSVKRRLSRAQRLQHLERGKYLGLGSWIPDTLSLSFLSIAPRGREGLGVYEWESASYVNTNISNSRGFGRPDLDSGSHCKGHRDQDGLHDDSRHWAGLPREREDQH